MRAMMRMLTTTYGESVSCTPIRDIGPPTGPMLNGEHIHRAAAHGAVEKAFQLPAHLVGIYPIIRGAGAVFR